MDDDRSEPSLGTTKTRLPEGHHSGRDDASSLDLPETREGGALPEDSTIWSALLASTVGPTRTWDWPTLRKLADELKTGSQDGEPPVEGPLERTLPERPKFRLDGYDVLEKIGQGGMGIVYKARKLILDVVVALKVLPPAYAAEAERLERFLNEGKMAAKLNDAHLLPVLDIEWADGVPVLVMPFIEGGDMAKIIKGYRSAHKKAESGAKTKSGYLTFNRRAYVQLMLPLLDQLVAGMGTLHDAGILHRDIKPSNCLVDTNGGLRLSDFGLARLKQGQRFTTHSTGLGTPGYMSPEAWEGRDDLDERADVFSLGVTIYQALTFSLPYERRRLSDDSTCARRGFGKGVPELAELEPVILGAIEPARSERYQSDTFRHDWRRVRNGFLPEHSGRANPLRRAARWLKRRRVAAASGFAAILLIACAIAWPTFFPRYLDPMGPQNVAIDVSQPCKRYAFIPLDPHTGEPAPHSPDAERGSGSSNQELRLKLKPGMYLLVVEWPDGEFHEVYRFVPAAYDNTNGIVTLTQFERDGDLVRLRRVRRPPPNLRLSRQMPMARIAPAGRVRLWVDPLDDKTAYTSKVDPFWLDVREFSVADYISARAVSGLGPGLPRGMTTGQANEPLPPGNTPIYNIEWQEAAHYLEMLGKRLPTWAEYQSILKGDYAARGWDGDRWFLGMVDDARLDQISGKPALIGLRSNVGEWTATHGGSGIPKIGDGAVAGDLDRKRLIFGAPPSVVSGRANPSERGLDLRVRSLLPQIGHWNEKRDPLYHVGMRGARSDQPRFLDP